MTDENKQSPMTAPNFCMLLRKHINNGFIEEITQPSLERIIDFKVRHLDELGDVQYKHLIVELMGKHSNVILYDEETKTMTQISGLKNKNEGLEIDSEIFKRGKIIQNPFKSVINYIGDNDFIVVNY